MDELHQKYEALKDYFRSLGSVAVAYSSGVDSTFLLRVAHDVLGEKAMAITATAAAFPQRESEETVAYCRELGVLHAVEAFDVFQVEGFAANPKNRCYLCKKTIFSRIQAIAAAHGITSVVEGSNVDDEGDYRPGMQAIAELGILSPLRQVRLTKAEIRALSKELGVPTWNKPSFACLASRFAYGETITREKLGMVERAEELLLSLGFQQERVRIHGDMARIEVLSEDFPRFADEALRQQVYSALKGLGFSYVSLDLRGYRTGSMNEVILKK